MAHQPTADETDANTIAEALKNVKDGGVVEVDGVEVGRMAASKPVRVARVDRSKPVRLAVAREEAEDEKLTEEVVRAAVNEVDGPEAAELVQATGDGVVTYHAPAA